MPCEDAINKNNLGFIDSEQNSSICECAGKHKIDKECPITQSLLMKSEF